MQVGAHIHMDDFRLIWPGQPNQSECDRQVLVASLSTCSSQRPLWWEDGPLLGSYLVNPAVSPV